MSKRFRDAPKSDLDSQRELLDSLMGINRNNDREDEEVSDFKDDRVCKFFLLGLCPHEMFVNTKADCGPCEKIHSIPLKEDFERRGDKQLFDHLIEKDFSSRVSDVDRVIERARGRLEEEKSESELNPDINPDIIRLQAEITALIGQTERAGDNNQIDEAQVIRYDNIYFCYLYSLFTQPTNIIHFLGIDE
jgi:hypothetical protein